MKNVHITGIIFGCVISLSFFGDHAFAQDKLNKQGMVKLRELLSAGTVRAYGDCLDVLELPEPITLAKIQEFMRQWHLSAGSFEKVFPTILPVAMYKSLQRNAALLCPWFRR